MGKGQFKKFATEAKRQARRGKVDIRFAVRRDDIEMLKNEGFTVEIPDFHNEKMAIKSLLETRISWVAPTGRGHMARKLNKMVHAYRTKCNKHKVTRIRKSVRQAKAINSNIKWGAGFDYVPLFADECNLTVFDDIEDEDVWDGEWDEDS